MTNGGGGRDRVTPTLLPAGPIEALALCDAPLPVRLSLPPCSSHARGEPVATVRALPACAGPVLLPPCSRQRPFAMAGALHVPPARRRFAPQRGHASATLPPLGFCICRNAAS